MAVLGIIAEFNPFHNGHKYLIEQAMMQVPTAGVVCVMSGPFTQRGEPALCNKWARAEMALHGGADLIIELPFCFATRSAYFFARGALQTLSKTGVVTHVAFGSEHGAIGPLDAVAEVLATEPQAFKTSLKEFLSLGLSFPQARARALQSILHHRVENLEELLQGPNNILAIEYLRIIREERLSLIPLTIPRYQSHYHGIGLHPYASAGAIRQAMNGTLPLEASAAMPTTSSSILEREIAMGRAPVKHTYMEQALLLKLRCMPVKELAQLYEINEGLEHRIKTVARAATDLETLRQNIKSKRYSLTRINRILLYSLFSLSKNQVCLYDGMGPLYLHILGFSARGQKILQELRNKCSLPQLNRGSDVRASLFPEDNPIARMLLLDVLASDIYALFYPNPKARGGGADFVYPPVRLGDTPSP
ncbi:MAG TPA: nucleotidyltransferase [Syntrophomonadaceae bacterium]|nr:nucleotidyltransferase [Syntrophomonadaceae bacterium]